MSQVLKQIPKQQLHFVCQNLKQPFPIPKYYSFKQRKMFEGILNSRFVQCQLKLVLLAYFFNSQIGWAFGELTGAY